MKKKLVALLLCFVMALSLIPTTVWAANMGWTWTVTVIGENYYKKDGTESNTNKYSITRYLDNSVSHEIGYKFEWNTSAGGSKYNGGWQLCLTVDGKVVERSTAYIYTKDMSAAEDTWTAPASSHTGNSSHPFKIYLSDYSNMAPSKPTPGVVQALEGLVNVYCTTENTNKATSKLISGTYRIGNVTGSANSGYTCTITIKENKVDDYMSRAGTGHEKDSEATQDREITLYYNATSKAWEKGNDLANLYAKCNPAPNAPEKPTEEEVQALYGPVRIDCATDNTHDAVSALKPQSYTIGDVAGDATSGYTCTITINDTSKYIPADHVQDPEKENDLTITLVWNNGTWGYAADAADTAIIYVKCIPAPVAPNAPTWDDLETLLAGKVNMVCETENNHSRTYGLLENTQDYTVYTVSEVAKNADDVYTCTVTIINDSGVSKYIAKYNDATNSKHEAGDTANDLTITLEYDKENSNWIATDTATINVKCTPAPVAPNAPTWDDLETLLAGKVNMVCETNNSHNHTYGLLENTYNTSEVAKNANGVYTCTVTIINDSGVSEYIAKYNDDTNSKHEAGDTANDLTITLEYDKENSKWVVSATDNTAIIYVKCTSEQEAPEAPTAEDLKSIRGVLVDCLSDPQAITHSDMAFPFFENTYEVGDVVLDQETDQYTCVVTVTDPQAYVNSYDFMLGLMLGKTDLIHHVMQPTTQTPTVTLVYDETNGWQRPERTYATITAICMIKAPTAVDLGGYKLVKVDCDTKSSHGEKLYPLLDGTFTTEVTFKDGIFQCVITITKDGAKEYVKQYGKDLGKTHSLKKLEDATITLTYKDNSWVVDDNDSSASILAKCSTGNNSNTNPSKPSDGKPVTSSKTFDAGIALYAGLSILSLTGGALVIRKRKEF